MRRVSEVAKNLTRNDAPLHGMLRATFSVRHRRPGEMVTAEAAIVVHFFPLLLGVSVDLPDCAHIC
jgi:hypothetical protein